MSATDSEQLVFINAHSIALKIALILAVIITGYAAYSAVSWQLAKMLAESAQSADRNYLAIASLAASLAPSDPYPNWVKANAEKNSFSPDLINASSQSFETVVRLSPSDYRYWQDLGRAREQNGDSLGGETALRRAVELAPNYAYPRWLLGNFLLRAGRRDEALAEFRRVAESHSTLRQQVFYLVWETGRQNPAELEQVVGNAAPVRAALVSFYAGRDLPDNSLQMWQSLSPGEKEEFRNEGTSAARVLYDKQHFRAAAAFLRELGIESAEVGQLHNGSFEGEIGKPETVYFGWRVQKIKNLDVLLDPGQKREGKRSLRLTFSGFAEPTLQNVTQYVPVEGGARYRLSFLLKTNELKSAGTPILEVVDARTTKTLGASAPFAVGTNDWQNVNVEFTTPADSEAVLVRTVRSFCGGICPIVGTVWYDDFKLERLGKGGK